MKQQLNRHLINSAIGLLFVLAVSSCALNQSSPTTDPQTTPAATVQAQINENESENIPIATIEPETVWLDPRIPAGFRNQLSEKNKFDAALDYASANTIVSVDENELIAGEWIYALVAPFPTLTDSISFVDFQNFWLGLDSALPLNTLLISEETSLALSALIGDINNSNIEIIAQDFLLKTPWGNRENTWAIVPFETLQPIWKIIAIDHQKPTNIDFDTSPYPLTLKIYTNSLSSFEHPVPSNFDPEKLTSINITGVTALVRATAKLMEINGVQYPAEQIKQILLETDYTHMVNEVSFSPDCPPPQYTSETLQFCSSPDYFSLLQSLDIDIIELTGDHLEDWGIDAIYYSLALYDQADMAVYGGGKTLEEAQAPLLIEHHGNKMAFIGCNAKSPSYAHAALDYPGTWFCDFSQVSDTIQALKTQNYTVIVTVQHKEVDLPTPPNDIIADYAYLAQAGADVIIGSQAHQPQTMTFTNGAFIHYGLGNLFFDQYNESEANRQSFIDRLFFYDGQLLNVELFTNQFIDWAQSRPMTVEERQTFLYSIYSDSIWPAE